MSVLYRFTILGLFLLVFLGSCAPRDVDNSFQHPKEYEDSVLIHRSSNEVVTMSIFGGELEPFNGNNWYLVAGNKVTISLVIELNDQEDEVWLESVNITETNADLTFEILNPPSGRWEKTNSEENTFTVFQATLGVDYTALSETIFDISAEVEYGRYDKILFFSRKVIDETAITDAVPMLIRPN